jgi:hypothetical protein
VDTAEPEVSRAKAETPAAYDHHPLGRCRATNKLRWPNRAAARAAKKRLRAGGDPDAARLGTYHCAKGCGDWHVGHRPEKVLDEVQR